MNDTDFDLTDAFDRRAASAPTNRPDFATLLADRQSRTRRRTAVATVGILVVGISGMAAFAIGGALDAPFADGPTPSGAAPPTTAPGGFDALWYCEGAADRSVAFPATTTTAFPATTIGSTGVADGDPYTPPLEDSGYFRFCVQMGSTVSTNEFDNRYPTTTILFDEQSPQTTTIIAFPVSTDTNEAERYVVQAGDYAILIADKFGVALEDLIEFNGWNSGAEFPFPGEVILIPSGADIMPEVNSNAEATTTAPFPPADPTFDAATTTVP